MKSYTLDEMQKVADDHVVLQQSVIHFMAALEWQKMVWGVRVISAGVFCWLVGSSLVCLIFGLYTFSVVLFAALFLSCPVFVVVSVAYRDANNTLAEEKKKYHQALRELTHGQF